MAENNGAPRASAPIRPTITLPVRSSAESFFRGTETSPGPMTLVSSFFSEYDPESECRSFSQLLAGAMASPNAIPGRKFSFSGGNSDEVGGEDRDGGGSGDGGEAGFSFKQNRPFGLSVGNSPFFTVPPGLSPTSLLDSPGFFSSGQGPFGISHQQALAQVTAQAVQTQAQIHIQTEYPSSLSAVMAASSTHPTGPLVSAIPLQQMPPSTSDSKSTIMDSIDFSQSDQRSHPPPANVDKPSDDGYNWRKYGQKTVKGSEYPRSYYKCTHPNCPVKKKVERSFEGQVTEIIYKGQHNHQKPQQSKRAKEGAVLAPGSPELNGNVIVKSETDPQGYTGNVSRKNEIIAAASVARRDRDSSQATHEQLSGSSDCEEGDADIRTDEGDSDEPDSKRRNTDNRITESVPSHRTVTEPRVIVQTTSEVDILDDGYRWRKYGQKVVKGNPHPRSYYKCTNAGCNVRKHVERASTDPKAVITTYEGKHNHDVPAARNSSHNTANSSSATNIRPHSVLGNAASVNRMDSNNYEQKPVAVLRFRSNEDAF